MELESRLKAYAETVDARLRELLLPADQMPFELHAAMRYSCLSPGKRLRPALCLASCEAVGGSVSDALDAACAIEMVHCFSLIHDDLPALDDDNLRRGLPTCHVEFGEALAILAGDALLVLAFDTLASIGDSDRTLAALRELTRAAGSNGLAGGEAVDILSEGKTIDRATLEFIHSRKTGALIAASCAIGALVGGGSSDQVEKLREFGTYVGLAFQIADDVLNETASAETLGKATGSDRERRKATYPAVYGLEESQAAARAAADHAIGCLSREKNDLLKALARHAVERVR